MSMKSTPSASECKHIETLYRKGFTATLDHEHRTIVIEYKRIDQATFQHASMLVEYFIKRGYDNL